MIDLRPLYQQRPKFNNNINTSPPSPACVYDINEQTLIDDEITPRNYRRRECNPRSQFRYTQVTLRKTPAPHSNTRGLGPRVLAICPASVSN